MRKRKEAERLLQPMTAKVILNPYSNRWNSQARWPEAETALKKAGVVFELTISQKARQVTELAEQAARDGFSPIIAAGGDGTIGEAVNGMAKAAKSEKALLGPLGILPMGSANDLVVSLGIPMDLQAAAQAIAAGKIRAMDVGEVNGFYFANNSAMGLEPYVTIKQQRITRIKGVLRYLVAAVQGIMDGPSWNVRLEWDGGHYEGPVSLVTVGNAPRTGGFYMIPHADPFDGRLSFVHAYRKSRMQLLAMLPKTMKPEPNSYIHEPEVYSYHMTWLKIHVESPTPAHTDGELFSTGIQDLEYRIHPGRLQILLP
ncbi:MAG: diacylglycerol kinase family lipid kinase [Chloroflexi bacterium]|nr:diacylglycerol kinase family lipid kinase [Chloroflexota bacterium]